MHDQSFLILGSGGQLGKAFKARLAADGIPFLAPEEQVCNITDARHMEKALAACEPTVLVNCAAYNAVDDAEANADLADAVNHKAVRALSKLCRANNILMVHYGTDYVFDGKKHDIYDEDDAVNPLNVYGRSKLDGERAVCDCAGEFLVFRPSWVFGEGAQNFITKLRGWAADNRVLRVSSDEASIPTGVDNIVDVTLRAVQHGLRGLYHLTNSGYASRYEWARYVLELLHLENVVMPVPMSAFRSKAERPLFTPMSNERLCGRLNIDIPHWKDAVRQHVLGSDHA
ncbi:MAG: dTDP-4-dehydrorhamnose reductase [Deltaproteobacteria bacterium]|nr:dTDP-4-dehydrorhamnose reductase [Deltaproteobacteria bacterium]MBW2282973.1 dTDP-4-dehydrorhamnose reductase [Deltaproteobacteria bacterium]